LGNLLFKDHDGFEKASSRKRYNPEIEAKLEEWMESNLEISNLVVPFGRKELEEYLFEKFKPKYNNKGKRTSRY
jgi:hypothetical protein